MNSLSTIGDYLKMLFWVEYNSILGTILKREDNEKK